MLLCHCHAVSDRAITDAIHAGARDTCAVGAHCGAGTRCGGCVPALEAMLAAVAALDLDEASTAA